MIAYLENLNHKGKLDDLLEGGFLQKWVPGFQKRKLTNQETNYLQALRPIFDKARPRQIAGWDTQGSVLNPFRTVQMLASIPKVIKRRQEWGPDWELKAKAVPMASQISAALANVNEASAKAQYLTGVSGDEVAEDTRTAPKKPMADVVEEKNGEKTIKRMPDQNAPDITYADAFAYYYADLQADTMGEAFMKQYKNMPDAQAVSAFKHDNMSSDYSLTPKRSLKEKVGYIERIMNPVAGVAHTITGKDIGFAAALPSGESAGSLWSKTKSFFTGVDNNSALGAMAYDIEDGNVAGAPKSFEQLIADGKASNPNQYVQYLSRHENLNDTEKLFSQNKIGELSGMTRVFYVDKPELNEVLQARTLTYTLGYPETATTKNITLEDIAKNSTELQFPSGPTAEYIPVKGNANQVSTAKQNLVFLTPDGYNYLWADEFLQEFDLDPSRAYSMLGLHKAIADKSKVSKKTAVDTAEEKDIKVQEAFNPSIVAINPEDIPSDFKL